MSPPASTLNRRSSTNRPLSVLASLCRNLANFKILLHISVKIDLLFISCRLSFSCAVFLYFDAISFST